MKSTDIIIKWTGSKRLQAPEIIRFFPSDIKTYYEPFLGGGSVLYHLLEQGVAADRFVVSDDNVHLMGLWKAIQEQPQQLLDAYEKMWSELKAGGNDYYLDIRRRFNETKDVFLFFFLTRTCRNGWIRFNSKGEFNTAFHHHRDGIHPGRLTLTVEDWNRKLNAFDVVFETGDYARITTEPRDFLYLDPPYAHSTGMYQGVFDHNRMWNWLGNQAGRYALSLDGFRGEEDHRVDIPPHLFEEHHMISAGLNRMNEKDPTSVPISDSLYLKVES
jgi:DNA adenine methylase